MSQEAYTSKDEYFEAMSKAPSISLSPFEMLRVFHYKFGLPLDLTYHKSDDASYERMMEELLLLRARLTSEESMEVEEAVSLCVLNPTVENKAALLKELADLLYVTLGFMACFDVDWQAVIRRVHDSNMSKLGDDGKPVRREDGKVLKGPNYYEPILDDLV